MNLAIPKVLWSTAQIIGSIAWAADFDWPEVRQGAEGWEDCRVLEKGGARRAGGTQHTLDPFQPPPHDEVPFTVGTMH